MDVFGDGGLAEPFCGGVPDPVEKLRATEDLARVGREEGDEVEFLGREVDVDAVELDQATGQFDSQRTDFDDLTRQLRRRAPEDGPHPGGELAW